MKQPALTVTDKEIFYTALMLGSERLIGVEYDFPIDEGALMQELGTVKRDLNKRKLLRENSKGEITLSDDLTAVAVFCSEPEECIVVEEDMLQGTIYKVGVSSLLLEPSGDDGYDAYIFTDGNSLDEYITGRIQTDKESESIV